MPETPLHRWDLDAGEARALQGKLAAMVDTATPLPDEIRLLAAADVSFDRFGTELFASVVVLKYGTTEVVEKVGISRPGSFPYIPGLLSFREAPVLLDAFAALKAKPDVVLCDGQGIAHPRRLGIASHLGLWLSLPTVGCAKSRLCGKFDPPGMEKGSTSPLMDHGDLIGQVLRTKKNVSPLFVSPGHRCTMEDAVRLVMACVTKYRLPDPARMAHEEVNAVRRAAKSGEVRD